MKNKSVRTVFWAMVAFFIISICLMFVLPIVGREVRFVLFTTWAILFGLGVALIVLTVKKVTPGLLRKFLLVTGSSVAGLPFFAVLHNLVTALCIRFFGLGSDFDEPVFFVIATIICPLGFLAGVIGTIVIATRSKPNTMAGTF
jgi:hypothetical protein